MSGANKPLRSAQRFFSELGPGFIAGAADDDPSGIAIYSTAGAALGSAAYAFAETFGWHQGLTGN